MFQACVSGMPKLFWRNQQFWMEQNLRAYFILYVITIKWTMCVEKKSNLSSMSQRPRLISSDISGDLCLTAIIKQQHKISKRTPWRGNKLAYYFPGVAFATPLLRACFQAGDKDCRARCNPATILPDLTSHSAIF